MERLSYFVASGSQRPGSQSAAVADYLIGRIRALEHAKDVHVVKFGEQPLPNWEEADWQMQASTYHDWAGIEMALLRSQALIFVTPEWDGMVPPALKNFLHHCSRETVGYKPCLIVGVSSSSGGSLPVAELRAASSKNNRILYIPDHVIIRNVDDFLNKPGAHEELQKRIDWTLEVLRLYGETLRGFASLPLLRDNQYAFGM